jgi:hypothetical protein
MTGDWFKLNDFARYTISTQIILLLVSSCSYNANTNQDDSVNYNAGSFGYDLTFLKKYDDVALLQNGDAHVIVSARYQAKVFTSSAEGLSGKSFGWINYGAFDKETDPHMNAYGGENRFWLGPEGNRFSLFFEPGTQMVFANWKTPLAIDTEAWTVLEQTDKWITLSKDMNLTNYAGSSFQIAALRSIRILPVERMEEIIGFEISNTVKSVGYSTTNEITNIGQQAWTTESGAPCIWMLDMFKPTSSTVIMVPYRENASGKVVTTDYFGEIPESRIHINNGLIIFNADGKSRGKIGVSPGRAKTFAGSFDPENNILTVVTFDVDPEGVYLNQEWTLEKDPFSGDAVNAYNDGPLEDGSQMGPFYELESVSPGAFLQPGESLAHTHNVFHFTGDSGDLRDMVERIFGWKPDNSPAN